MGGFTIIPDCSISDIAVNEKSVLLLPGANTWNDPKHGVIIEKAGELLLAGATVCAICGATVALASAGLLDHRPHTSNGMGYLEMCCPHYKGQHFYVDNPSVADHNLITASSTGALLWARQIIERLEVFRPDTLEAWYNYFSSGKEQDFFTLMQTLPPSKWPALFADKNIICKPAGGEPPHRALWAAAPGISQTGTPGTVQLPYPDREIMDIPCRPERAGGGTAWLNHWADESCRWSDRGAESPKPAYMGRPEEQDPQPGGGNHKQRTDLYFSVNKSIKTQF